MAKVVEIGDADEVYEHPIHPYTESLLSAVPIPDPIIAKKSQRIVLSGDVPSPMKMLPDALSVPAVDCDR